MMDPWRRRKEGQSINCEGLKVVVDLRKFWIKVIVGLRRFWIKVIVDLRKFISAVIVTSKKEEEDVTQADIT